MSRCCQNRIELFCLPTLNLQHFSVSHQAGTAFPRCLIGFDTVGLQQHNSCWSATATQQTSVCRETRRYTGFLCQEVRSCHSTFARSCSCVQCAMQYRLAVLALRCQHGMAPPYLLSEVPVTSHWSCLGRNIQQSATRMWNSLSLAVTQSSSLSNLKGKLKTKLFCAPIPIFNCNVFFLPQTLRI